MTQPGRPIVSSSAAAPLRCPHLGHTLSTLSTSVDGSPSADICRLARRGGWVKGHAAGWVPQEPRSALDAPGGACNAVESTAPLRRRPRGSRSTDVESPLHPFGRRLSAASAANVVTRNRLVQHKPSTRGLSAACHSRASHWHRTTLAGMAPRRRPRGSLVDPVPIGYVVERAAKERLDRIADLASVSSAVMFEHILEHLELTSRGLPVTWPEQELHDGELPIDSA